jgi:hypothetical protein
LLRFFVYFCVFNWAEILDHCLQLQMAYKLAINVETERWSFLLFRWLQHRGCREFHRKIEFLGVLIRTKQRLLKNSTQRWVPYCSDHNKTEAVENSAERLSDCCDHCKTKAVENSTERSSSLLFWSL